MAEHRVLMLRDSLLGRRLPERSADPRLRTIEDGLGRLRTAPDPDPLFRADLRAQLVAIAPRLVAEGSPGQVETTGKHRAGATRSAPATAPARHTDARGRRFPILRVVTAMLVVAALLLGGAYWQSRDALPGDNLYGLKRAGERVQLAFAGDDGGRDQLNFSETRVDEVLHLWKNAQPPNHQGPDVDVDPQTAALITNTLNDANAELRSGASQLNRNAVRARSTAPVQTLTTWADRQGKTLAAIKSAMTPSHTNLLTGIDDATALLNQAKTRATRLKPTAVCSQHEQTDQLGPKPCS